LVDKRGSPWTVDSKKQETPEKRLLRSIDEFVVVVAGFSMSVFTVVAAVAVAPDGVYLWCLSMVSVYGVCLWCLSMVSVYGVCLWCLSMVSVYGVCLWCLC
jgi:hypothetical protein